MAEYSHFSANFSQISKHWFTKNTPLLFLVIRNVLEHAFFLFDISVYQSSVMITEKPTMKLFEVNFTHTLRVRESITMHGYV